MSHRIISMTDAAYFDIGTFLLATRDKVNAEFTVYGPNLTEKQINVLKKHNIEYIKLHQGVFDTEMQSLKFVFMKGQLSKVEYKEDYVTYIDWDTFIVKDWTHDVYETKKFNIGVTCRNEMIKDKCYRAFTNGGVIFSQQSDRTRHLLQFFSNTINYGSADILPEYDEIWNTLEKGRSKNKTHYRTNKRWWCDQVILSSLVLNYIRKYNKVSILDYAENDWKENIIGMFNCEKYNSINAQPMYHQSDNYYIGHLKQAGRVKNFGLNITKEKL